MTCRFGSLSRLSACSEEIDHQSSLSGTAQREQLGRIHNVACWIWRNALVSLCRLILLVVRGCYVILS